MITAKEISRALAQRAEDVARYLLPNGKKEGNEWRVGSINGEAGKSLAVRVTGEKAGLWCDFATGNEKGDLLDLWALSRNIRLAEAINEAKRYLGIFSPQFVTHRPAKFTNPPQKSFSLAQHKSAVTSYLINDRKLTANTLAAFKISERSRDIVFPYWRDDELIFVKYISLDRPGDKKQVRVEANCEPCLFGWHLIPSDARKIAITEGEIDAMTLYQYGVPALSVPFGAGSGEKHKWLEYEYDRLSIYDEIYLCFDNDTEGRIAVEDLIGRLGRHRCRVVELPLKDANDCLQAGIGQKKIQECFDDARSLDPVELKRADSFLDKVIAEFNPVGTAVLGYFPPWKKAVGKIHFRPAELSVWTGINGHGKSQFLGQVILSCMKQGARVCIASLELKPERLLMRLTRQTAALQLPTVEYIREIHRWYGEQLWLFDLVGTAKSQRLLDVFLYARQKYGIDVFVIDSFMKLDIAEDDYNKQKSFMEQLCDFKNQHNCQVHVVVHPRKATDESQIPGKLDNKGTGAISDLADNCFTIWRNKHKENLLRGKEQGNILNGKQTESLKAPDCFWICDKQRNGDWEGKLGFSFHAKSFQYLEFENDKAIRYVDFSMPQGTKQHKNDQSF